MNEFIVDDEELGELLEVTVGHDNTGSRASWHMDHMVITNVKTGQKFLFPCRWASGMHLRIQFMRWWDILAGDVNLPTRILACCWVPLLHLYKDECILAANMLFA